MKKSILDQIEENKKPKKQPAQVKMDQALHQEVSMHLAARGISWQEMLMAGTMNFLEECRAKKTKKVV